MRLPQALGISIALVLLTSVLAYSQKNLPKEEFVDVLIGFKGEPDVYDEQGVMAMGGDIKYVFEYVNVTALRLPKSAIKMMENNPNVSFIEPDGKVTIMEHTSTVPEYQKSWGVDHIQADKVHNKAKGNGVNICILDTGIDYNHPDLAGRFQVGKDFVNGDDDPLDDNGHGTAVSGVASAILNGAGVVGAAPEANLYVGKVLNQAGSGFFSDVIAGIEWCVQNNVKIINMSFGAPPNQNIQIPQALEDAVNFAYNSGVLLVAAAGNAGNCIGTGDNVAYPARYDSVIAVTNTNKSDQRPCILLGTPSTGPAVELSAPGLDIESTWLNGSYKINSGTSFSTPHVSGSAALLWLSNEVAWQSAGYTNGNGVWTNTEIRTVLDMTAKDLGPAGRDNLFGFGLVRPDLAAKFSSPNSGSNLPAFGNCILSTNFEDPISMNAIASTKGGIPIGKIVHSEKQVFNCELEQGNVPVIADVTIMVEVYHDMSTRSIVRNQAEVITCLKNLGDLSVIGCKARVPPKDPIVTQNCVEMNDITHKQEMSTIVSPTDSSVVKTVEAQKEVFNCTFGTLETTDDKKVDVIIFTSIWEDLDKLNGNTIVKRNIRAITCVVSVDKAIVESCKFSTVQF
ncbi:MAG: S8 family peptidase [Nitrososphaerales archaeon]